MALGSWALQIAVLSVPAMSIDYNRARDLDGDLEDTEAASQRCTVAVFFNSEAALRAYGASLE